MNFKKYLPAFAAAYKSCGSRNFAKSFAQYSSRYSSALLLPENCKNVQIYFCLHQSVRNVISKLWWNILSKVIIHNEKKTLRINSDKKTNDLNWLFILPSWRAPWSPYFKLLTTVSFPFSDGILVISVFSIERANQTFQFKKFSKAFLLF